MNSITISFGDFYRPDHIVFSKKSNTTSNFEPWHYLVTEMGECENIFAVPYKTFPSPSDPVLCTSYDNAALQTNENVSELCYTSKLYLNCVSFPFARLKQRMRSTCSDRCALFLNFNLRSFFGR